MGDVLRYVYSITCVVILYHSIVVGIIISMEAVISPSLKSYITRLVKKEDLGKGYSAMKDCIVSKYIINI